MTAPLLSCIYPFYANPTMLAEQCRVWAGYPHELKRQIEILIIDDGTPAPDDALGALRLMPLLPAFRLYRVLEDRPWHQHGCRNLGAQEAQGAWLFLTDMDHVLPTESLAALLPLLNYDVVYTFARLDAPDLKPKMKDGQPHPHPNTFAMTRARYWRVGGYDEEITGYGTDGFFRKRLYAHHPPVHLHDVPIIRYPREVIADASTRTLLRKDGRDPQVQVANEKLFKEKLRKGLPPKVLDFPWRRVL